jgi:hypothetical protein
VFEEFRQVGTAAKKVEGTGLGLTYAGNSSSCTGQDLGKKRVGLSMGFKTAFQYEGEGRGEAGKVLLVRVAVGAQEG